jgi:hypothetical protein
MVVSFASSTHWVPDSKDPAGGHSECSSTCAIPDMDVFGIANGNMTMQQVPLLLKHY